MFRAIDEQGLDSNVSVKLTGMGLKLDLDIARENLERTVKGAAERGNFVRIDMEDSSCTDDTLRLYRELREKAWTTSASSSRPTSGGRWTTSRHCKT